MRALAIAAVALIAGSICSGFAAPAIAQDAVLVSDNREVTLVEGDNNTATSTVTLTNPTTDTPTVTAEPMSSAQVGCKIAADPERLEPLQQQKVTLKFSAACDVDREEGIEFKLTVGEGPPFNVQANPSKQPSPNWIVVGGIYVVAAILAFLFLLRATQKWTPPDTRWKEADKFRMSLPGLSATWKFADSWAANATVVTALFTGLFGTEKVTIAILGEEGSTDLLALALVSAAISVGLAGLSPMVLQMLRKRFDRQGPVPPKPPAGSRVQDLNLKHIAGPTPANWYVTPWGLIAAAVLTLAATVGQLASILYGLLQTDFAEDWILIVVGLVGLALLGGYAWTNTQQNLTIGATLAAPEEKGPSPAAGGEKDAAILAAHELKAKAWEGAQFQVNGEAINSGLMLGVLEEATTAAPSWPEITRADTRPSAIL